MAVAPAMISVWPGTNSLIGMPKPTRTTPTPVINIPKTSKIMDIGYAPFSADSQPPVASLAFGILALFCCNRNG